jgi:23S rRNA (adenine1618-N6)-methyltransferase
LKQFVFVNDHGTSTIDFANNDAVIVLNKALLSSHYQVDSWKIPNNYLCPPIPGRADYIHHLADLLGANADNKSIRGLDIGVGANCIYPILGSRIYNWKMVGADISEDAVRSAVENVNASEGLTAMIEIRHQLQNANIFEGIIAKDEYFDFSMCNPPFHTSKAEAIKGSLRKLKNLQYKKEASENPRDVSLNFGGQAHELWCNGGEVLFIKRMIKQSVSFKTQVGWFTTLVSKKEHLPKIYKQLDKLKAKHTTVEMEQGKKRSRFVAWTFRNTED